MCPKIAQDQWRPEQHGQREPTMKRAKKALRQAKAQAQRSAESLECVRSAKNSQQDDENA